MYEVSRVFHTPHGNIRYWINYTGDDLPWLVSLPGLSADHTLFDKQMDYFARTFNCFVWDAPAHVNKLIEEFVCTQVKRN